MTQIAIPATIVAAQLSDIFAGGLPRQHQLYFFYKPAEQRFCGAFYLHEDYDVNELSAQVYDGMLYVLGDGPDGYTFLLNLEPAQGDDLKDGRFLRLGFCYYLRLEPEVVEGPYYLATNTDVQLLAGYLNAGQLYVVSKQQSFAPFSFRHTA